MYNQSFNHISVTHFMHSFTFIPAKTKTISSFYLVNYLHTFSIILHEIGITSVSARANQMKLVLNF